MMKAQNKLKSLSAVIIFLGSLLIFTSVQAIYICTYQVRELITISILSEAANPYIVFQSNQLHGPVSAPIDESFVQLDKLILRGSLPTPWLAGTEYEIKLDLYSPISEITYFAPEPDVHSVTIPMSCKR